jgi:hypothetical protein
MVLGRKGSLMPHEIATGHRLQIAIFPGFLAISPMSRLSFPPTLAILKSIAS